MNAGINHKLHYFDCQHGIVEIAVGNSTVLLPTSCAMNRIPYKQLRDVVARDDRVGVG